MPTASQPTSDFKGDHLSVKMFAQPTPGANVPIGDGASRPLSGYFPTLLAAQAVYPIALDLTDELAWCAIQTGMDFCADSSYELFIPAGAYPVNRTLDLRPRVSLRGHWGGAPWNGLYPKGTRIVWTGPVDSVILSGFGVSGVKLSGVSIDGGSISGCTAILWDSVNAPISSGLSVDHMAIVKVGIAGFDGTAIKIGTGTGVGGYQCDSTSFHHVYIYLVHTGVHFNSFNSAQGGCFADGQIAGCVRGFLYERGGSLFEISNVTGSLLSDAVTGGQEGAFIDIQGIHGPIILDNVQVEAGWGCFLRVEGFGGVDGTIELRSIVTGHKIALRTRRHVIITGGYMNCDVEMPGDNILLTHRSVPFLDPTNAGYAPFSTGTIQVTNGSAAIQLNGTTEWITNVFDRGTFSTDGGATEYVFTSTGLQKGVLDRPYTGATNAAATYSIYNVPKRAFVNTGINNLILPLTPGVMGALFGLPASIPGYPAFKIEAEDPNLNNPKMLALVNGAQEYDFQVSGASGAFGAGSLVLFDNATGLYPFVIKQGAPLGAITVGANGLIPLFAPDILFSDGTGNLPNSFPDGKQYTQFVNGVPGFPGSTFGTVQGYRNSGSGDQYSYQIFHEVNHNELWLRTATSATTWGSWIKISGGTVTHTSGALTSGQLVSGRGGDDVATDDLTGDVTTSGTMATVLAVSGVTAATYGDGTHVPQVTVDAKGRVTSASNVAITSAAPTGAAGGSLTGSYPNPGISASDAVIANLQAQINALSAGKANHGTFGGTITGTADLVTGVVTGTCSIGL